MNESVMKLRKTLLLPLLGLLLALTGITSCGENRWAEYYPLTGRDLWIDSLMREVYLWYEDIPSSKSLNYFQDPAAFLSKLLSPLDKGFSTVDTLDYIPVQGYGFDYTLYKVATSDTTYNALVSYVVPGSPAADAGLERGEWIMLIDGDSITKNTEKLLTEGSPRTLSIGKYVLVKNETEPTPPEEGSEEDNNEEGSGNEEESGDSTEETDTEETTGVILADRDIALSAARALTDPVIHARNIFQIEGTNYRVAYLAYNAFNASPAGEDNQTNNDELKQFSQACLQAGVNRFVLDLRYNAGGEMDCVQLLASMLVPADKLGSSFAFLQYNDKQSSRNRELTIDPQLLQGGVNLNLTEVYILTSSTTAGAAEMLINCLKPYMTVVLIGQTTKGEYVATETFTHPAYAYAVRPVVCEVFNAQGEADYSSGFRPDYSINESAYFSGILPLGNPDETLLNTALNLIAGNIGQAEESTSQQVATKQVRTRPTRRSGLIIK